MNFEDFMTIHHTYSTAVSWRIDRKWLCLLLNEFGYLLLLFVCVRYERVEIPLYIKPVHGVSDPCLQSLVQLPDILLQEEDDLYHSAREACGSDLTAMIHNGSGW